ncbi:MAG: DNA gyrase subunit A [Acidobacteria bacterium]|nr:DNA gyrase subunit A [Acidobacteriota bacterium]
MGGNGQEPPHNIVPINIEDEMRRSYLDYAMSVIIGRALPEVRDGLKPVQRRILYAMHEMGLASNRKHSKCAGVVGEVLKKFHPHGDTPVYDALVRLAQGFNMRYPLIDPQGNFGSVDGDPPAAYRYTEARLAAVAEALLADIEKDTVDSLRNFDDTVYEPKVLPSRVPNLLVNGGGGIAVGMATNIPPHNLSEIIDATVTLIEKPDTPLEKIIHTVPGPDFPTGGYIYGRSNILESYRRGRGKFVMRAKAAIERQGRDKDMIVVTEIPYQVNKARLIKQTAELVQDKKIEGISDIRDESDRQGMRIVFELKRGEQPEVVLNQLFKHTDLQTSFDMILLAIVSGQPRELGLIEALKLFIDHRIDVVRRRTEFELRKAREREHVLLGFQKALDHLDAIIKLIRAARAPREAREQLMAGFDFTERQAVAILELQLQRLTAMEREKISEELAEIQKRIASYLEILSGDRVLRGVVIRELREVQKQYGDERRTQILDEQAEIKLEDLVTEEDVAITVSHQGYLKRTPVAVYRTKGRGAKGQTGMRTREEDFVEHLFVASTHSYILVFTTKGRVYWLKVYEIPDVGAAGRGKNITNLVNTQPGEKVAALLNVGKEFHPDKYVVMVSRDGVIKKSALTEFDNPLARGIIAMGLDERDELISAKLTNGAEHIFLASHEGISILFPEDDVRGMGRQARGVNAMDLGKGDYLIGMEVVSLEAGKKEAGLILTISENGYGKRTPITEYRVQSRAGKGIINLKTTERNGKVVSIMNVREDSELMVITQQGKIIRVDASGIRETGRSAQGVRLQRLEEGDRIAAASLIPAEEAENGNGQKPLIQ